LHCSSLLEEYQHESQQQLSHILEKPE